MNQPNFRPKSPLIAHFRSAYSLALMSLSLGGSLFSPVHAQQTTAPIDPGQLLRQEQTRNPATFTPAAEDSILSVPKAPAPSRNLKDLDQATILIREVRFTGKISMPEEELQALVREGLNRELSFSGIQGLADKVAAHYRKNGFFLAQALVPTQDISDGRLVLHVIEGRLSQRDSKITVTGHERTQSSRVAGMLLEAVIPERGLNESDLERGILLVNDLPGIKASVIVEPGEEAETSRLNVAVKESSLLRGSVSLDNVGNRFTGELRAGLNLFADNLTGEGDQLALQTTKAVHGDFSYGRLAYLRPVGYSGLILGAAASTIEYTSGKQMASLEAMGDARSFSVNAQYPLYRSRPANLILTGSAENRLVKSQTMGLPVTDKKLNAVSLGLQGDYADGLGSGGITSAALSLTQGRLNLDRLPGALAADQGAAGQKTQGSYNKLNFSISRLQSLSPSTVGQFSVNGQHANQNLDSGEKFSLGGPSFLKSYPAGEALGDRGLVAGMELRTVLTKGLHLLGFKVGDVQFRTFYDTGTITQFAQAPQGMSTPNTYWLRNVGLGLNIGNAGVYDLRISLAHSLGDNPGLDANGNDSSGQNKATRLTVFTTVYF